MKTFKKIKEITVGDLSFFKGISLLEAKFLFCDYVYKSEDEIQYTRAGAPIVSAKETLPKENFDFTIRSNSELDGKNQMEYLCDFYNKGVPLNTLREHSSNKAFINALAFSGSSKILNQILNQEQLFKLQKTWLLKNCLYKKAWKEKALKFIINKDWAKQYLISNGISESTIDAELEILLEKA